MTSISVAPPLGVRDPGRKAGSLDKLPDEMNEMKLRDDKVWGFVFICPLIAHCLGGLLSKILDRHDR